MFDYLTELESEINTTHIVACMMDTMSSSEIDDAQMLKGAIGTLARVLLENVGRLQGTLDALWDACRKEEQKNKTKGDAA